MYPGIQIFLPPTFSASRVVTPSHLFAFTISHFTGLSVIHLNPEEIALFLFFLLLGTSILTITIYLLITRSKIRYAINMPYSMLAITPPWDSKESVLATTQLMTTLHTLGDFTSTLNSILGRKITISLELVSTKEQGIRYIIRAPKKYIPLLDKNIKAFLPGAVTQEVSDYLPKTHIQLEKYWDAWEFSLTNHFALPLAQTDALSEYDPIAYITSHMANLNPGEFVSMQFILSPVTKNTHRRITGQVEKLRELNSLGLAITGELEKQSHQFSIFLKIIENIFTCLLFVLFTPFTFVSFVINSNQRTFLPFFLFTSGQYPQAHTQSDESRQTQRIALEKLDKQLFETTIRIAASANTKDSLRSRIEGLITSLSIFQNGSKQGMSLKRSVPYFTRHILFKKFLFLKLKYRLLSLTRNPILSTTESASLYHFPYSPSVHTEGIQKNISQTLPAPLTLKQLQPNLDVIFAKNSYSTPVPIGLTTEERIRHVYLLGATGTGKTTLLKTMILSDLARGKGLCVIDPHGDLITELINSMPDGRIEDTILFDPSDTDYPVGLNLLSIPKNLTSKEKELYKIEAASALWSVFTKLYEKKYLGPRMEHILRNATLTAFTTENPTLITIHRLLIDITYRKRVVSTLSDPALKLFWKEFDQAGSMQRAVMIAPITNKLGKFLTNPISARILGQKESTIDFTAIMNESKILLVDVSKGKIGEDNTIFFGSLITAQLELAAQRRIRQEKEERIPFYLYIDEFQNFAAKSFAAIMSESRKYGLAAVLAHQTIAQIEDHDLINVILANTGTIITFRTGSPVDEDAILPYFRESLIRGDISNLPSYHFYIKTAGFVPQSGYSGETILLQTEIDIQKEQLIRHLSRAKYALPVQLVALELNASYTADGLQKSAAQIIKQYEKHE
jgi:hypothetical protein